MIPGLSLFNILARFALIFCIMICLTLNSNARTQRMAIPAGSYSIGESGSGIVRAFCVDAKRPASTGNMSVFLGSGSNTATVTRLSDDITISLSKAISDGWLSLIGTGGATDVQVIAADRAGYRIDVRNAFAVAEQADEIVDDISSTLTWLDTQDMDVLFDEKPVWAFRSQAAEVELSENVRFASLFDRPEQLLELFYRLNKAESGTIALTHRENPENDAFDRVVFLPGFDVQEFSGANADRDLIQQLRDEGQLNTIWLTQENNFEQAKFEAFGEYLEEKITVERGKYWNAQIGSREQETAEESLRNYTDIRSSVQMNAVEIGLQLSAGPHANPLVVSVLNEDGSVRGGIINQNNILTSFDSPESSLLEMLDSNDLPLAVKTALDDNSDNAFHIGQVKQENYLWTVFTRALDLTKESIIKNSTTFRLVFSSVISGVRWNQPKQSVINDIQAVLDLEKEAYEAYPRIGEAEVKIFIDEVQELKFRVALIDTPYGIRLVALNR